MQSVLPVDVLDAGEKSRHEDLNNSLGPKWQGSLCSAVVSDYRVSGVQGSTMHKSQTF